jgi:hypothetical protein
VGFEHSSVKRFFSREFIMHKCLAVFMWMLAGLSVATGQVRAPSIAFDDTTKDLGKIAQGEVAKHVFSFRNQGTGTLKIMSVETS